MLARWIYHTVPTSIDTSKGGNHVAPSSLRSSLFPLALLYFPVFSNLLLNVFKHSVCCSGLVYSMLTYFLPIFNSVLLSCVHGTLSSALYEQSSCLEIGNRNKGQELWEIYARTPWNLVKYLHLVKYLKKLGNRVSDWEKFKDKEE